MNIRKHRNLLSAFFITYSILQGVFAVCWSLFVGVFGTFMFIISGMAHSKSQQNEAEYNALFTFIAIVIVVSFALFSTRTIYRTGNTMLKELAEPKNTIKKAVVLSVLGMLINAAALIYTFGYLLMPKSE